MLKPLGVAGKALIRKSNKILLIQRSNKSSFDPGLWELPGGKITYGEDLVEALIREVHEETGFNIYVLMPFKTWHFYKEPYWVTGVTFLCDWLSGKLELSEEHISYQWICVKDYEKYALSLTVREQLEAYFMLEKELKTSLFLRS